MLFGENREMDSAIADWSTSESPESLRGLIGIPDTIALKEIYQPVHSNTSMHAVYASGMSEPVTVQALLLQPITESRWYEARLYEVKCGPGVDATPPSSNGLRRRPSLPGQQRQRVPSAQTGRFPPLPGQFDDPTDPLSLPITMTRDGYAPRPPNAFLLYRRHHYAEVAAEHQGASTQQLSRVIGAMWREASAMTRDPFIRMSHRVRAWNAQAYRGVPRRRRGGVRK